MHASCAQSTGISVIQKIAFVLFQFFLLVSLWSLRCCSVCYLLFDDLMLFVFVLVGSTSVILGRSAHEPVSSSSFLYPFLSLYGLYLLFSNLSSFQLNCFAFRHLTCMSAGCLGTPAHAASRKICCFARFGC